MPAETPDTAPAADAVVAVISDTHLPRRGAALPDAVVHAVRGADLLIHAGDLTSIAVLRALRAFGPPVVAVHGNADDEAVREILPETATVEVAGLTISVVHDAGPEAGRLGRLRRRFPECDIVVFGHSHIPLYARDDGFVILNPGSATDRRRQPHHSMARIRVVDGALDVSFVRLDEPVGILPAELVRTAG